jgi:hypothetical protein
MTGLLERWRSRWSGCVAERRLLYATLGDREKVERLVNHERRLAPHGRRHVLLARAWARWRADLGR